MPDALIDTADSASHRRAFEIGPGRLPRPLTSFVGRERELSGARQLLENSRLSVQPVTPDQFQVILQLAAAATAATQSVPVRPRRTKR